MLDRNLDQLLSAELIPLTPLPDGNYVVYGAGNIGREVLNNLIKSDRTVAAFIDARITGQVADVPIYAPDHEAVRKLASEGHTAVIGIFNYSVDPLPIHELLQELGFHRIVSFNEFQEHFALPPHYWLTNRAHAIENRDRVLAGWNLLDDDVSRRIFFDSVDLRLTQNPRLMRQPTWAKQYLSDDLPRPEMPLRFIDGGAFTGDTIEFLLESGVIFDAVAAFEPDPANFSRLGETVQRYSERLGDTTLWPCGISNSTEVACFRAGRGSGSAVNEAGDTHIQLVSLDEALPSFAPTYIKLDIEGSELAALQGGRKMIQRHQPSLAVCVYHRPEDLWELPLFIRSLLPDHRIALRYHTYQAFELVAYAFPSG